MLRVIILLVILTSSLLSMGQTFPNERDKFVREFEKLMRQSTSENLRPFIREELSPLLLEGNEFSDAYFNRMVETANSMVEKRLNLYPEVYTYVFSVYTLVKQQQPKKSYDAWHSALDQMLSGRNVRRTKDFIEVSGAFFSDGIIALNPNYEWVYKGGEYSFSYKNTPFIHFEGGTLTCRTINRNRSKKDAPYTDSLVVYQSTGVYDLLKERYEGNGGILTWEKVGLPKNETFAELTNYELSMKSTNFSCDTVILTTPYFESTVKGSLVDRARRGSINQDIELPYPQFQSFERKYEIKNLVDEVDYLGGFSLQGDQFVGEGTSSEPARLTFFRNGKAFVKTASAQVRLTNEKVTAENCAVRVFIGLEDSIYHPGLLLNYLPKESTLQLIRGNSGISQSPFVNSYHKLDMYVEQIIWEKSNPLLNLNYNFATSQQQRIARFESFDYYDERLFQHLQGMERVNPLAALWAYAYKYDEYVLPEGSAATALDRTIQQAKSTLLELSALGFISYDTEKGIVTITPKLEHFVKAKAGKKDYDNITFVSDLTPRRVDDIQESATSPEEAKRYRELIEKRNKERERLRAFGSLDIGSLELNIKAIDQVPISDIKNTLLFPEGNEITVKKNRSIHFAGWVNSGKWEVHIAEGNYSYEKNGFNIFESDIALFRADPLKPEDGNRPILVQSPLSGIKGELLVDDLNNRSGLNNDFVDYPKLTTKEKSRVYYDHKTLYRGAYEKDRFYFEIDPFELDSLATFNEKHLRFSGSLTSAGIFPKFEEELKIMPDYSLGFARESPEGGFPFYGTDAKYDNKIVLSNNGLQGSGQIDFINSTSISQAFTFLPDSTIGVAKFTNRPRLEDIQLPDITGPNAFITFLPRSKVLKARSNQELLSFFDGEAQLRGETIIREEGINGKGLLDLGGAFLTSKNYKFKRWIVDADTANFNIANKYNPEPGETAEDPLSFKTENVTANVDFEERKGEFKSNDGESVVEFPVNKYICKMDMFTWLMDTDDIAMEKSADEDLTIDSDLDLVGPNFYSTHPKQDSLQFRAPKATFNLKEKTIYCSETEFIEVADARIYPDSMKVVIRKNAKMDPLKNSTIVANLITKYHKFDKAETQITARKAYSSKGNYPYYDMDSNLYEIYMPSIGLDTSFRTIAKGTIKQDQEFKLSPQFDYYGEVTIKADNPLISFNGATRINHNCERFDRNWMSFNAPIDPQNILIPVSDKMTDLEGNSLSAGIVWRISDDIEEVKLYPTFLSSLTDPEDPIVITSSGFLNYNAEAQEFQIGSQEKLINRGEKGNYLSLHTGSCSMNGDGVINLGMDYGTMEVDAVGIVNYNQANEETSMNLTLRIKAPLDEKLFENTAKKIASVQGLNDVDFNSTTLEQAILEWVDRETADRIKSDFALDKRVRRIPREMREAFILTGVQLVSYKVTGDEQVGLRTSVDQAGIVNLFNEPVMKYVPLKLFAQQRTDMGDRLGMLIDVPGGYLYFFDYDNRKTGTMNILTSDAELMNDIDEMKPDKRKEKKFMYQTTKSSAYQSQFLRVFK